MLGLDVLQFLRIAYPLELDLEDGQLVDYNLPGETSMGIAFDIRTGGAAEFRFGRPPAFKP